MNSRIITVGIIGAVVCAGGGFYAGTQYQASTTPARVAQGGFNGGNFAGAGGRGNRTSANAAFGTIIAKDASSITVKLGGPNATSTNGTNTGSKIVLYDTSTQIGKMVSGSTADLLVGQLVIANGTPNSDGSITAQMIQIRPAGTPAR